MLLGCQNVTEELRTFYLDEVYYNSTSLVSVNGEELKRLEANNGNFIIFVYMPMCNASAMFRDVVEEFIETREIAFYQIQFSRIGDARIANAIRHFPTAVIYRGGVPIAALDAGADEHIAYYQTADNLEIWLSQYIYLERESL